MAMLPRLAALATASARLHLRRHVLAFPDAVLAVKAAEESCAAKVGTADHPLLRGVCGGGGGVAKHMSQGRSPPGRGLHLLP